MTIKIPMNNWSVMLRRPLPLGYVGENNVEVIHIDIPDATATYQLYIEPKYEGNAYWLPFDSDGNLEVTQSDFQKSGMYNGQIVATWSDESVKKSNIFAILIDKSICPVASQEDIDGFTKALAEYAKQVEDCKTTAETVTAEAKTVAEEAKEASKEARTASEEAQTVTAEAKKVAEEAQTATATAKAEAETAKAIADEIQAKADSGAFNGKDGAKGEKGDQGIQGEKGDKGDQGEKGDKGDTGANGEKGDQGEKGDTGSDGFSPTASVSQSGTDTTISITDKSGTTEATITELSAGTGIDISDHIVGINQTLEDRLYTMQHTKRIFKHLDGYELKSSKNNNRNIFYEGLHNNYRFDGVNACDYALKQTNYLRLKQGLTPTYYATLDDAINGNNPLTDATGAVFEKRGTDSVGYLYTMLTNYSLTDTTYTISQNIVILLNGKTLSLNNSKIICPSKNQLAMLNGTIDFANGSQIQTTSSALYLLKCTMTGSSNKGYLIGSNDLDNGTLAPSHILIADCDITLTDSYCIQAIMYAKSYIGIFDTKVECINGEGVGNPVFITGAQGNSYQTDESMLEVSRCDIKASYNGSTDLGDSSQLCFCLGYSHGLSAIFTDSTISGENDAIETIGPTFIRNTTLAGGIHGGIYSVHSGQIYDKWKFKADMDLIYIMDSTLQKRKCNYSSQNYYACYFGYGSNVVCDGVKFLDADGNLYTPAIKDGSGYGLNTEVSLSNCELKSVRCDSGCTVNLGRGISDTVKNASVSGTKNLTEDVYRYDLVLDM